MDKAERERLLAYLDLEQILTNKISINEDLLEIEKGNEDHDDVRSFLMGKIQAFETIELILKRKINDIRGITDDKTGK